jgi:hypothetical protein
MTRLSLRNILLEQIDEELLTENPNQAIKFLKEKNLDPATTPRGKKIFDLINGITRGDGYTALLTRFYVADRINSDDLIKLHEFLRTNKELVNRLPWPVVNYVNYQKLRRDIEGLEDQRVMKRLYNQLSPQLREQLDQLSEMSRQMIKELAKRFEMLNPDQQRHFMKKVFGYKDIHIFSENLKRYINEVENKQDYEATKQKILSTDKAVLIYDNPEQDILIAHIISFEASEALGCTSAWCITRDTSRFREYKKAGQKYFFIWDYNYPMDDPNFFIATAYDEKNPDKSKTHEHLNDKPINLKNLLDSKHLNFDIFNNYLEKYNAERVAAYGNMGGLFKALTDNNRDAIIELIYNSEQIQEYKNEDDEPHIFYNGTVELGIKRNSLKQILELGEEFEYISNTANNDYGYSGNYDSDESNYMQYGLNQDNMNLIIDIAKKIGIPKRIYNKFKDKEGALSTFLKKYGFEGIIDTYLSEKSEAEDEAGKNAAKEIVAKVPFDVDDGSFEINKMLTYYVDNELTASNFDELFAQIKEKLPEFSYEDLDSARYYDIDLDDLNREIKNDLEKIILDIESDENHPYYEQALTLDLAHQQLRGMGFKSSKSISDIIGELKLKSLTIQVKNVQREEQDDGSYQVMAKVYLMYNPKFYAKIGQQVPKTRAVKIPFTSLKHYVDQLELPIVSEINKIKSMMSLIL